MEERIPIAPPGVPILDTANGPFWSVMIPVYNCIDYLKETIESVLQQDSGEGNMQIEVVDDGSTDGNVEALVSETGKGRVKYYCHPENRGSLRCFETAIKRANGRWVHLLHGDDRVKPGFYAAMKLLTEKHAAIGAAFCRAEYINENGKTLFPQPPEKEEGVLTDMLLLLGERQRIETPAIVVKRSAYEQLGAFRGVVYGEDWDMWIRIAAHFPIAYTSQIMAQYRRYSPGSITYQKLISADNIKDIRRVMELTREYFPKEKQRQVQKKARHFYARYAVRTANILWIEKRHTVGAYAQLKAALGLTKHPIILLNAAKIFLKIVTRYANGRFFNSNLLL